MKFIYKNKMLFVSALIFILSMLSFSMTFKMTIPPILGQFSPRNVIQLGGKPNPWRFYKLIFILTLILSIICFMKAKKNLKLSNL